MTVELPNSVCPPVPTDEIRTGLERVLSTHYGRPVKIAALNRRPWEYRSSFALEALEVDLQSGEALAVMFKDLSWQALTAEAQRAKPHELYDPLREICCYEKVLRLHPGFGPTCYGAVVDADRSRYWLFIEQVRGRELYQIGEFAVWEHVAGWLAGMHAAFRPALAADVELQRRLIQHSVERQRLWLARAQQAVERQGGDAALQLTGISGFLPGMASALSATSPTLIHGEFYASNILILGSEHGGPGVRAVDWEMAGLGCELIDLAALVVGRWTEAQQNALALAYYIAAVEQGDRWPDERQFFETLDYCRLYLALQWLGWSDDWSPPPPHAHDWLGEALSAAQRLSQRRLTDK